MPHRISILTAVYNGDKVITNCMKSVRDQDLESKLEHLVVDGNSSDETVKLVQEMQKAFNNVQLLSEPDNGQSDAMNKGLRLANGSVVGFLNADDLYEPGALDYVLNAFEKLPKPSLLVGNCRIVDAVGKELGINRPSKLGFVDLMSGATPPYNPCAYFYHKSIHDQIGYYDESDHYTMDLDFLLRAVRVAHVQYVDRILGTFVWHPHSKTAKAQEAGKLAGRIAAVRQRHLAECGFLLRLIIRLRLAARFACKRFKL